jgi:hypothetical protein
MPTCKFCGEAFTTPASVQKHQSLAPDCRKRVEQEFQDISRVRRERRANASRPPFSACNNTDFGPTFEAEVEFPFPGANVLPQDHRTYSEPREYVVDWDATAPTNMVEIEAPDEEVYSRRKVKRTEFPIKDGLKPGHAYRLGKTAFQSIRDDMTIKNGEFIGPFKDAEEWELARWLIKNVGHGQVDELLKLLIVSQSYILHSIPTNILCGQISERARPSFDNKRKFLERIDSLPEGVEWQCEELEITGDEPDLEADRSGNTMHKERLEFWYRDPVECVRELIGKPSFDGHLKYAPEQHFADVAEEVEVINEMWTASWWWKIQVSNRYPESFFETKKRDRNNFHLELLLHHSSSRRIKPSSQISEAMPRHGLFISQLGIFQRRYVDALLVMGRFCWDIYRFLSLTASTRQRDH